MKLLIISLMLNLSFSAFGQIDEPETETIEFSFDRSVHGDLPTTEDGKSLILEGDIAHKIDRSGSLPSAVLWSKGIMIYEFANRNATVVQVIKEAMKELEAKTTVRFKERTNEKDYVLIGTNQMGCWSHMGRVGGAQELNLQLSGCVHKGTVMHELLHAFGILHEQSRYDRDQYVTILEQNMPGDKRHNFSLVRHIGSGTYDLNSIMHYGSTFFSINGRPTMTTKDGGIIVANRDYLTSKDIAGLNELYANQINGGSVRPSINLECDSDIAFIDTKSFDDRLREKLKASNSNVCVKFSGETYTSIQLPERMEEWLAAIKESNGKVEYQETARGWMSKLIDFFIRMFSGSMNKYEPAKSHHALVQIDKGTKQVFNIIFYPR